MANEIKSGGADDPYELSRFVQAQEDDYEQALAEIRSGRKRSHWMWYIFPQYDGLGFSSTSKRFAIKSTLEAEAYLSHSVLGPRLVECAEAALGVEGRSASEIFGSPDDMKLKSCATLFASVSPAASVCRNPFFDIARPPQRRTAVFKEVRPASERKRDYALQFRRA